METLKCSVPGMGSGGPRVHELSVGGLVRGLTPRLITKLDQGVESVAFRPCVLFNPVTAGFYLIYGPSPASVSVSVSAGTS